LQAMDAMLESIRRESKPVRQEDVTAVTSSNDRSEAAATQENVTAVTSDIDDPPVTFAQKRADALLRMADQALAKSKAESAPAAPSDRFQVIVHLNAVAGAKDNACTVEHDGHHLPLSHLAMRRLACDATLLPVVED